MLEGPDKSFRVPRQGFPGDDINQVGLNSQRDDTGNVMPGQGPVCCCTVTPTARPYRSGSTLQVSDGLA